MTATDEVPLPLDLLIGEVESEAARRRAAPGYPHELESQIEAELARQAPTPSGRLSLERLVTAVEEASFVNIDAPVTASRREYSYAKGALKRGLAWYLRHIANQVSSLGFATARTLRAMTARIEDLEDALGAIERTEDAVVATRLPQSVDTETYLSEWLDQLTTQMAGAKGRVLYADADTDTVVAQLRAGGFDAYGLTREGSPYQLSVDVRHGDLIAHLAGVADEALAAVMLAGFTNAMDGASIRVLVTHLARCVRPDGVVVVVAESPWWWRERLDPAVADMADARPLAAETWLAALHPSGFDVTANYAPDGHSYAVIARREAVTDRS